MKMKQMILAVIMLMALTACKNSLKESAEMIDLPRSETPENVSKAMDDFFEQAAKDSMDIHSVMIVRDGCVIFSYCTNNKGVLQIEGSLLRKVRFPPSISS